MGNTYPITFDDDRITDSQQISTGPTKLQAFERALAELIDIGGNGVAFAQEIEKAPFAVNQYGWLLGSAAHATCPGIGGTPKSQEGLRLLDNTNHSQGMICVNNGYLEVYKDSTVTPDFETSPSWGTYKNRLNLTTGLWELESSVLSGVSVYNGGYNTSFGDFFDVTWAASNWDEGGYWPGGGSATIEVPDTAYYIFTADAYLADDAEFNVKVYARLHFPTYDIYIGGVNSPLAPDLFKPAFNGAYIAQLNAHDQVTLQIYYGGTAGKSANCDLTCWKLGDIV